MGLFKKKLSDEEMIKKNIEAQQAELEEKEAAKNKKEDDLGDSKLGVEVTKIKAQLEGLNEQRQAVNERFSRMNEEIGEIRGMMMDTNKSVGNIEASATKAIDLVESVKPDQLMLEVRKQDSKIESVKAGVESSESLMRDMMKEVKEMRKKIDFYKGIEQVNKLNEEIKAELIDIKKIESIIERHSNKVETIYIEVEKKFVEFDKFNDSVKDLKRSFDKMQSDFDKIKIKLEDKTDKKELLKFITKFNDFEKHTNSVINLMDERSKSTHEDVKKHMNTLKTEIKNKLDSAITQLDLEVEKTDYKPEDKKEEAVKEPKKEETKTETQEEQKAEEAENQKSEIEEEKQEPTKPQQEQQAEEVKTEKQEQQEKEETKTEKQEQQKTTKEIKENLKDIIGEFTTDPEIEKQLEEQILLIVEEARKRGKTDEEIKNVLVKNKLPQKIVQSIFK
jgi:chromosome segregation ATPase